MLQLYGFQNSQVGTSGQTILASSVVVDRSSDVSNLSRFPSVEFDMVLSRRPRPKVF